MKAKAINTDGTAHGNAISFCSTDKSTMLFLEFMSHEKYEAFKTELKDGFFVIHFSPYKNPNEKCAQYINVNR